MLEEFKQANIEVLSNKADIYPYAFDTGPISNEVTLPLLVAVPKSTKDVQTIVKICNKNNLKIISRGAGTCHTSGCKPCKNSIVIHFSKMNNILEINKENLTAIVEPGVIVGQLQREVDRFGLFFPPDPSNLKVSTIGGAIALSSGGARAFKYGTTKDYVINLEVVLADGSTIQTAKNVSKNVEGYNLTQLFTGSEGTLGIITKAVLKLIPKPETKLVTMAYFNSVDEAASAVNNIISSLITPATIDLLDRNTIDTIEKFNPSGWISYEAMLLVELDGGKIEVEENNKKLYEVLIKSGADKIIQANPDMPTRYDASDAKSFLTLLLNEQRVRLSKDVTVTADDVNAIINTGSQEGDDETKISLIDGEYNIDLNGFTLNSEVVWNLGSGEGLIIKLTNGNLKMKNLSSKKNILIILTVDLLIK